MSHNILHFANSPLTEAVIDIRAKLREGLPLSSLASLQTDNELQYPTRRDRWFLEGRISANPETPAATGNRIHIGYDFVSTDERQIVQARLDGFSFSRLAPYESWNIFSAEARRWWNLYRNATELETVTRLAVRYINRIDIPLPINDLKDYLRTVPEVSSDMPQGLSGYFMQLQIPQADLEANLILNQALVTSPKPEVISILLDIDIYKDNNVSDTEDEIWKFFEQLRIKKNEIFLACITQQTRELIS